MCRQKHEKKISLLQKSILCLLVHKIWLETSHLRHSRIIILHESQIRFAAKLILVLLLTWPKHDLWTQLLLVFSRKSKKATEEGVKNRAEMHQFKPRKKKSISFRLIWSSGFFHSLSWLDYFLPVVPFFTFLWLFFSSLLHKKRWNGRFPLWS